MVTDSRRDAWQGRLGALLGGVVALAVLALSTACARSEPSAPPPAAPTTAALPAPAPQPVVPLPRELVGRWETQTWLDSSGSQAIVRTYRFGPDGRYDYSIAICRSSTDCTIQADESGYAQAARGVLALRPQTPSADGPRAFPYVVGRDPDVGDVQLHLTLADGRIDVFYAG